MPRTPVVLASVLALTSACDDSGATDPDGDPGPGPGAQTYPANLSGEFTGTLEGDMMAELIDAGSFRVILAGASIIATGEGTIDGDALQAVLASEGDAMFGTFSGTLEGDEASGEWSFATPAMDAGTWTALRE